MSVEEWARAFFDPSNHPERFLGALVAVFFALVLSFWKARKAVDALALFVGATDEFETRGGPTTSLKTLMASLGRSFREWWTMSKGVSDAIGRVLLFGYVVPTIALIAIMFLGTGLRCGSPLFVADRHVGNPVCGASIGDISANAMYRHADAASLGALSGFNVLEPSVAVKPTGVAGRSIYFLLGVFVAIAGSLSLVQLLTRWIGNLFRRWIFKFEKFAKHRQSLREPHTVTT